MAYRQHIRRPSTSPMLLAAVPEQDVYSNNRDQDGANSLPSDDDQRSVRSLPTEYGRSYRMTANPRPRNPVDGWQARNLSNILPVMGSEASIPMRPIRRPSPHSLVRSQIFPETPRRAPGTDFNNNPEAPLVPGLPPPNRGRRIWPWQARAQTSSIFTGEYGTTTTRTVNPTNRARTQWPWQERAKKSVIFDILSSKEIVQQPPKKIRSYVWDQRKTTILIKDPSLVTVAATNVSPNKGEVPSTSTSVPTGGRHHWPWQERAQQSVIFRPPDKPDCPRKIKYMWDQRRSRFSVNLSPEAKFPEGSHYKENFVVWQRVQDTSTKAAGKPCYQDQEDAPAAGPLKLGKRGMPKSPPQQQNNEESPQSNDKKKRNVIALPAPSSSPTLAATKVKGATCLEIVPTDYEF